MGVLRLLRGAAKGGRCDSVFVIISKKTIFFKRESPSERIYVPLREMSSAYPSLRGVCVCVWH